MNVEEILYSIKSLEDAVNIVYELLSEGGVRYGVLVPEGICESDESSRRF